MKALLALLVAGSLAACQSTGNTITVTTNDGRQIALEDSSIPSSARDGIVMAKIHR